MRRLQRALHLFFRLPRPYSGRLRLLWLLWRYSPGRALGKRPPGNYRLRLGRGALELSQEDFDVDRETLWEIFVQEEYGGSYAGATVVDIGGHKGYYGAFALLKGARSVESFEPASRNFHFLDRAAASFRAHGLDWRVHQAAVTDREGRSELDLSTESWGHSLRGMGPRSGESQPRAEEVTTVSLRNVLEHAGTRGHVIVKLDCEGCECAISSTPPTAWRAVTRVFVEWHEFARCSEQDIIDHLSRAGFALGARRRGEVQSVLELERLAEG